MSAANLVPTTVALLGVGGVGGALLARWPQVPATGNLRLRYVANSRGARWLPDRCAAGGADEVSRLLADAIHPVPPEALAERLGPGAIVVDATASDAIAACHRRWLEAGLGVVTANKAAIGGSLAEFRAIVRHAHRYGDSATVGAGLPLLRSVRDLRVGGDEVIAVAGVLSGTLAWLFDRYDGERPFSSLVEQAQALGYCEPDPRADLSGCDVLRKLLILARSAGAELEPKQVRLQSLLPPALAVGAWTDAHAGMHALDDAVHARWREARAMGRCLRFVARWSRAEGARIGPEALAPDDPLLGGHGCDNRVAIWSCRYREQPLVVQGPGAGAAVTAAALLDDVLRLADAGRARLTRSAA